MKITKQRLKEIIKEELSEASEASIRGDLARPAGAPRPSSNPPEWESTDKILRDLVYLAQDLEDSSNAEPAELAFAIVGKLREAVDAMEVRLQEKFAAAEDEVSDEEALVLKGPQFDPLGDSLPARRQRASVRRGK